MLQVVTAFVLAIMQACLFVFAILIVVGLGLLTIAILRFFVFLFYQTLRFFWKHEKPKDTYRDENENRSIFIDTRRR